MKQIHTVQPKQNSDILFSHTYILQNTLYSYGLVGYAGLNLVCAQRGIKLPTAFYSSMRLLKCWGGLDCTYTKQTKHWWENRPKSSAKPRTNEYGIYLHICVSCAQIGPQLLLFLLPAERTVLLAVVLPSSVILHHYDPGYQLCSVDLPLPVSLGYTPPWLLKKQETAHRRGCHS